MNLDGVIMKPVSNHVYLVVGVYLCVTLSGEGFYLVCVFVSL